MIAHLSASTLVALVAVAAGIALRGRNSAWRHALLIAAIFRFAVPTPWLAAGGSMLAPYAHAGAARPASVDRLADFLLFGDARLGSVGTRAISPVKGIFNPYVFGWVAGFALCLTIWVRGLFRGIPSIREATMKEMDALSRARRAFGVGAVVRLRIAAAEQAPGVRGIWRASIILPDGLSTQLTAAELEAVLRHEFAHVRRRDNLSAALAHLVVCVFWFYPLMWWLERRMLSEREAACDEMVLAQGANAEEYLSGLVKVCRMSFSTAAGYAGASGSNFQTRMERIMSADITRSSSPIWRAGAAAVVALAVMIPVGGAFLKAQPAAGTPQAHILTPAESQVQTGLAMLKAGNLAGAEEAFRMAHELDPKNTEAIMGLVEALIKQGKAEQAIDLLDRELAHGATRADLRMALGNTAVQAGKYTLALTEFQTVLETLDPDSAIAGDVHMRMAEVYRRMGKLDAALTELRSANNLLPQRGDVVSTLALVLESSGRWEEAEKEYQAALRVDPNNAVALNNMAYLLSQHGGSLDEALNYVQRAAKAKPEMPEISDTLGTVYLAEGMTDKALEIFRQILLKSPAAAEHLALKLAGIGQRDAVWADLTATLANHHSREDDQAIAAIMQKLK